MIYMSRIERPVLVFRMKEVADVMLYGDGICKSYSTKCICTAPSCPCQEQIFIVQIATHVEPLSSMLACSPSRPSVLSHASALHSARSRLYLSVSSRSNATRIQSTGSSHPNVSLLPIHSTRIMQRAPLSVDGRFTLAL